ncbi:hotdog domain-containing protein [Streptomyces olivoreticuli]|uniref:Coronafacic acid dehydratase n=1 Tax=Streptomyces blastmyceticus TaxID=68180 RepID=A0ABP3HEG1_9ACTN|nr:hotdog domain-containing protein [Streptomyces olivoreticuli]WKK24997.1 hotdog domain-containing protein [Streptomyces olivoreticuli]
MRGRHPRLFIDRVLDHEPGVFLRSMFAVSAEMGAVSGHLPERGLTPGVILPGSHTMQAFAQSGVLLYQLSSAPLADDEVTLVGTVKCRFLAPVVPGDQVVLDVRADRLSGHTFTFSATAKVEDRPVARFRAAMSRAKIDPAGARPW